MSNFIACITCLHCIPINDTSIYFQCLIIYIQLHSFACSLSEGFLFSHSTLNNILSVSPSYNNKFIFIYQFFLISSSLPTNFFFKVLEALMLMQLSFDCALDTIISFFNISFTLLNVTLLYINNQYVIALFIHICFSDDGLTCTDPSLPRLSLSVLC